MKNSAGIATTRFGIGFIGAGASVQAIHLPTLARLPDLFGIAHVVSATPDRAAEVAGRVGARYGTSVDDLMNDPHVEVVAICSPPKLHTAHILAAMDAGKKAVLCEKPLATSLIEARVIAERSLVTGVPLLVGAMHTFDPGWLAAMTQWKESASGAHTVRVRTVLPQNQLFEDWSTEMRRHDKSTAGAPNSVLEWDEGQVLRAGVTLVAVHDLPLVRFFLEDFRDLELVSARLVPPFGYALVARSGVTTVHLIGQMHDHSHAMWEVEVISDDSAMLVSFTPPFVHSGSAVATWEEVGSFSRTFGPFEGNGYENEWRALHSLASGSCDTDQGTTMIEDLEFTMLFADLAVSLLNAEPDS
jgi:myo-inositol 2-dehydrogenase/D-chiro-inositol 1-dehydrogenase